MPDDLSFQVECEKCGNPLAARMSVRGDKIWAMPCQVCIGRAEEAAEEAAEESLKRRIASL